MIQYNWTNGDFHPWIKIQGFPPSPICNFVHEHIMEMIDPKHALYHATELEIVECIPRFPEANDKNTTITHSEFSAGKIIKNVHYHNSFEQTRWISFNKLTYISPPCNYTGEFRAWWSNGKLMQCGQYKNGQKEGKWVWHDFDIDYLRREDDYVNGKLHGNSVVWCMGRMQAIKTYQNDIIQSEIEYDENCYRTICAGNYKDEKKHGKWIDNYNLSSTKCIGFGEYDNGVKVGIWVFYMPGYDNVSISVVSDYDQTIERIFTSCKSSAISPVRMQSEIIG